MGISSFYLQMASAQASPWPFAKVQAHWEYSFCGLKGTALLSLAVWRVIWPRGTHAEANVWLFHSNGQTRFYQPSQISWAEDVLGLTIKQASVQARQSINAINIQLRWNYWYLPCPFDRY
jgi:hypothetical protein